MARTPLTKRQKITYAVILAVHAVLFFALYRAMLILASTSGNAFPSFLVMAAYSALLLGFGLAYLIYNRFFFRMGLTKDDLPDSMTKEQKDAFLQSANMRLARSRWMLLIILPLLLTFLVDALEIFVLDQFF